MVLWAALLLGDVAVDDVHLVANDGLNALLLADFEKFDGTVHNAVVCQRDRTHS